MAKSKSEMKRRNVIEGKDMNAPRDDEEIPRAQMNEPELDEPSDQERELWEKENLLNLGLMNLQSEMDFNEIQMRLVAGMVANPTIYNGHADKDDVVIKTANRLARALVSERVQRANALAKR